MGPDPITSPIAFYEAVLAVARERRGGIAAARADIKALLAEAHIRVMPIEVEDADLALEAFAHFGKGQGHPARLNMGDCFAYAGARRNGVPLLFKEDDFSQTDIET
ncbi:type II toxin-antitoxin system VapC family toxin [Methylobacterium amylolyticum]|uniref:type II toxin-antitoxin system VapC family toxin n=1 Tax=Methylobacterium sp. NEAU 140 TaxID=3064945 RepID=UPI00351FC5BF